MVQQSLEILTFRRLQNKECYTHKLEPHTTLRLKSGKTNHMIISQIFGLWGVSFTRCVHWYLHLERMTWMDCSSGYWRVSIQQYQVIFQWTSDIWSKVYCRCNRLTDQTAKKYLSPHMLKRGLESTSRMMMTNLKTYLILSQVSQSKFCLILFDRIVMYFNRYYLPLLTMSPKVMQRCRHYKG